jgi:hypothetical protein
MPTKAFLFILICLGVLSSVAQGQDDNKIQIHGYATQGFLYSSNNNFLATKSKQGDFNWQEAVATLNSNIVDRLRIGVQIRASQLGQTGAPIINLDWASADYQYKDYLAFRVGKVKTPIGLLNETQDIDPAHVWSLLPQNMYSLTSRGLSLAHEGADVYGSIIRKPIGKVTYKAFLGGLYMDPHDGFLLNLRRSGVTYDSGPTGKIGGGNLNWEPVNGLTAGVSVHEASLTGTATVLGNTKIRVDPIVNPYLRYEHGIFAVSGEYNRLHGRAYGSLFDTRNWYAAATVKATKHLSLGSYYLQEFNVRSPLGPARFSKDWTVSARWDLNDYFYLKTEGHFVKGEAVDYYTITNPTGLKPDAKLLVLKIGASF